MPGRAAAETKAACFECDMLDESCNWEVAIANAETGSRIDNVFLSVSDEDATVIDGNGMRGGRL